MPGLTLITQANKAFLQSFGMLSNFYISSNVRLRVLRELAARLTRLVSNAFTPL